MSNEKERKEVGGCFRDAILPQTAEGVMDGAQNERMGPGEDRQRYDSEIDHSAAKAIAFQSHHTTYQPGKKHHARRNSRATNRFDWGTRGR